MLWLGRGAQLQQQGVSAALVRDLGGGTLLGNTQSKGVLAEWHSGFSHFNSWFLLEVTPGEGTQRCASGSTRRKSINIYARI